MENIVPALAHTSEKTLKELSPQEFQQMLSSWFEEKGLISELKAYLKFQMINILKNTAVGRDIKRTAPQNLAQQALHLVVAEYLLRNYCNFTFSLFTSEINLSNVLPESKLFLNYGYVENETTKVFDKANLTNILELLGITRNSQCFSNIIERYFDGTGENLLECLVNISKRDIKVREPEEECKREKSEPEEPFSVDKEPEDDFLHNVSKVLQTLDLPNVTYKQLMHNIKLCYDLKTRTFESQCIKLVSKFKKELGIREQRVHEGHKQKKLLEKQILKLEEENQMLKDKIEVLYREQRPASEKIIEKLVPSLCEFDHCTVECKRSRDLCNDYRKEVENLKKENNQQKEEINKIVLNCNDLVKEFNLCQNKVNLVNMKLQKENLEDMKWASNENNERHKGHLSSSSDSYTEELLQKAREKLKLLEEESENLDLGFSDFIIK